VDTPVDTELAVDAAQVAVDGGSAEEQLGGDVPVDGPARGELSDLKFLRGEPEAGPIGTLPHRGSPRSTAGS
jgi:hypothetical protein